MIVLNDERERLEKKMQSDLYILQIIEDMGIQGIVMSSSSDCILFDENTYLNNMLTLEHLKRCGVTHKIYNKYETYGGLLCVMYPCKILKKTEFEVMFYCTDLKNANKKLLELEK